jgi:hypothetical protein
VDADCSQLPVKLTSPPPDAPATPGARLSITISGAQLAEGAVGVALPLTPEA